MKLGIQVASASQTINVFIRDTSSTTGAGLTGLVYNSASLVAYYALPRAAAVAITLATQTVTGAFSSGGFVEISSANMPGWYRLDVPDAALASGRFVSIHLKGATNMAPLPIEIELTGWNNQDAVHGGLTCLPNTAVTTNGSLLTSGTGTAQISTSSGQVILQTGTGTGQLDFTSGVVKANATQILGTAVSTPATAGILDVNLKNIANAAVSTSTAQLGVNAVQIGAAVPASATIGTVTTVGTVTTYTGNTPQTGDAYARLGVAGVGLTNLGDTRIANLDATISSRTKPADTQAAVTTVTNLTNAPGAGDFTATMKTSLNAATPASVVGAVGSVTGAVGSVTGAVGSVTGAVGSVAGNVGGNVVGSVGSVTAGVTVTGDLSATMKTSVTAAVPTAAANAAAVGARTPTESYAADGAAPTYDQFLYMLWACMAQFAISGTTISTKKLDGTTEAMVFTTDSSTAPTSRTRTT